MRKELVESSSNAFFSYCCGATIGLISIIFILLGIFEIIYTSGLTDIYTSDATVSISSSYVSVIIFALTLVITVMICVFNVIRKKQYKLLILALIILVAISSLGCVFLFAIHGFECVVGTGFESLWTSTVDIDKTLFEHEYSCCGYKELTVLCGCTSDEEGDCEQTCHDKVIHPFGLMFITSSLGAFAIASMLIVVAIMFGSKLFCQKHKYIYTRI